jgi:hypothetical protein
MAAVAWRGEGRGEVGYVERFKFADLTHAPRQAAASKEENRRKVRYDLQRDKLFQNAQKHVFYLIPLAACPVNRAKMFLDILHGSTNSFFFLLLKCLTGIVLKPEWWTDGWTYGRTDISDAVSVTFGLGRKRRSRRQRRRWLSSPRNGRKERKRGKEGNKKKSYTQIPSKSNQVCSFGFGVRSKTVKVYLLSLHLSVRRRLRAFRRRRQTGQ